jgi:hypothetical protein
MNHEQRRQVVRDSNRLTTCAMPLCGRPFAVCGPCDRGRRYCSPGCSVNARRARQREASRRYQSSERGRLAHQARQARYRERAQGVTHRSSEVGVAGALRDHRGQQCGAARAPRLPWATSRSTPPSKQAASCCDPALAAPTAASVQHCFPRGALEKPPACAFCRRPGRFLRNEPRRLRPRRRYRPGHT